MDTIKLYDTLDSTNNEARRLLTRGPVVNGMTLLARHQEEGRGQYGRVWFGAPGAHLAMSIILQPDPLKPIALEHIGMFTSLGIVHALRSEVKGLHPRIKWPNDIYLGNRKLAGILIENALSGSTVQHSIIGIGMNVNETDFPPDLPNPVSLRQATGSEIDIITLAHSIRASILNLIDTPNAQWKADYDKVIYGLEERHSFLLNGDPVKATIKGVSSEGKLTISMDNSTTTSFATHEIQWQK